MNDYPFLVGPHIVQEASPIWGRLSVFYSRTLLKPARGVNSQRARSYKIRIIASFIEVLFSEFGLFSHEREDRQTEEVGTAGTKGGKVASK